MASFPHMEATVTYPTSNVTTKYTITIHDLVNKWSLRRSPDEFNRFRYYVLQKLPDTKLCIAYRTQLETVSFPLSKNGHPEMKPSLDIAARYAVVINALIEIINRHSQDEEMNIPCKNITKALIKFIKYDRARTKEDDVPQPTPVPQPSPYKKKVVSQRSYGTVSSQKSNGSIKSTRTSRSARKKKALTSKEMARSELGKVLAEDQVTMVMLYLGRLLSTAKMRKAGCYTISTEAGLVLDPERLYDELHGTFPALPDRFARLFYRKSKDVWEVPPRMQRYVQDCWRFHLEEREAHQLSHVSDDDHDDNIDSDDEFDYEIIEEKRKCDKGFNDDLRGELEAMNADGMASKVQMEQLRKQLRREKQRAARGDISSSDSGEYSEESESEESTDDELENLR